MSGGKICYWARGAVSGSAMYCWLYLELCLAGSVVTVKCGLFRVASIAVQCGLCWAVSFVTVQCELHWAVSDSVVCYVCFLMASFITVQYELFLVVSFIAVQCGLYIELRRAVSFVTVQCGLFREASFIGAVFWAVSFVTV